MNLTSVLYKLCNLIFVLANAAWFKTVILKVSNERGANKYLKPYFYVL